MASVTLKRNYRCSQSLQQFYSGGPFVVSSDGSFLGCACGESIKIVDSSNASTKSTIEAESGTITALALSPNDKLLFSAGHSRQIKVWDLDTFKCLRSWKGHDGPIMGMACHGSGGLLATAGADRKVLVWDVYGGFCTHYFKGHKGVVTSIMFHPDINKSLTTVRVWDLLVKKCVAVLEKHFLVVSSVAVSEDGWTLLSAGRDKVVNLWDLHDYKCKSIVPTYEESSDVTVSSDMDEDSTRGFISATMLPLDQGLLCVTADQQFLFYSPAEHLDEKWSLKLTKRLVRVYDLSSMSCSYVLAGHTDTILCHDTSISDNRRLILTGRKDNSLRLWESERRCCIGIGIGHMGAVGAVAFSKKRQDFFSKAVVAAHDKDINSLAVAPNDSLVCSGSQDRTACHFGDIKHVIHHSGADGLVKLWTIKTNECIATYDQHEDKVWALAVGKKTEMLATGVSDAVINLWYDATAAEKEEAFRKEEEGVLRGKELENAVLDAEYTKAIQFALELRRPHKLFELFSELCRMREAGDHIDKALHALGKEEFLLLFGYIREWNTKPKLCHVAQSVIFRAFNILPPKVIIEIKGISELLEGLIPYSQRHFSRIDRLIRSTFLLDYTVTRMSVIEPVTQDDLKTKSSSHSRKNTDDALLTDNAEEDQKQVSEGPKSKASARKRKSRKSGDTCRSCKRVKDSSVHASNTAVPLRA
ncbi:hypothetical protein F3Y22_tig00110372pilonHSYRG00187 [Hibiscus syriacus]|uniref:U3 small nucleolar RNA-associated protein 13 C-terminal domain-containing protein n=1 Tax=Hibiscus syriacus TaxID=106335 RepID=A0A6A3AY30_HIBSY|nr:hypothetical protein F3Y22_tig00110372pilonHSYRG00187 [Hibiscus syriacus]